MTSALSSTAAPVSCSVSIGSDFSLLSSLKVNRIKKIESVKFFLQELAANTLMGCGNLQKAVYTTRAVCRERQGKDGPCA